MARYVNPFHLVVVRDPPGAGVDQLFGRPAGIGEDRWPEADGKKLHHLLTLRVDELDLPLPDEVSAVSIFFRPPGAGRGPAGPPFVLVRSTAGEVKRGRMADYPSGYEPWWDDRHPLAASIRDGLGVDLEVQDIPEEEIESVLLGRDAYPDHEAINAFANEQSYVGGFPVWTQEDETPVDASGERTHFVLCLNGYNEYLETSPIGGQVSFLFMDEAGKPYWAAQD